MTPHNEFGEACMCNRWLVLGKLVTTASICLLHITSDDVMERRILFARNERNR